MTDLLATGFAWLRDKRDAHMARSVTYRRGKGSSELEVEVNATVGRTKFEATDGYGFTVKTESRDYLVKAEDLVLDGQQVTPEEGDLILERDGSKTYAHEVLAPEGRPPWRYSDPMRRTLRIHTKLVTTTED